MIRPHATSRLVPINQWDAIPVTPKPQGVTGKWRVVSHIDAINSLIRMIEDHGWLPGVPEVILSKDNRDCAVTCLVDFPAREPEEEFSHCVCLINQRLPRPTLRFLTGVMVGKVGVVFSRSSRRNVGGKLSEAMTGFATEFRRIYPLAEGRISLMKKTPMPDAEAVRVLITCGRRGLLPWSRVGLADRLFREGDRTRWGLTLAVCAAVGRSPCFQQVKLQKRAKDLFRGFKSHKMREWEFTLGDV